jgi:hypothetical protein
MAEPKVECMDAQPAADQSGAPGLVHRSVHGALLQVLAWLSCKVDGTKAALAQAHGTSFAGMDDSALSVYAVGLVAENLSREWEARLMDHLGLRTDRPGEMDRQTN